MGKNKAIDPNEFMFHIAKTLWPELSTMSEPNRLVGAGEVIAFLYTLPLALYGLIWLIASTDVELLRQEALMFLLILAFSVLFAKISYFIIIEIRQDRYGSGDGSLAMMVLWSALFIFGPTVIWLAVIWAAINFGWTWWRTNSLANRQEGPQSFTSKESLPWDTDIIDHKAIVVSPILNVETGQPVGGIYIELRTLVQPRDTHTLTNLFPAIQALSAQIASALHQSAIYQQTLEYQKISQELQLAGRIQASFLPNQFPNLRGWQLAVTLLPARETSGDLFDVIQLSDNRLGVLIADVADKGIGPALYMVLSRTLIRTYAVEYDADPDVIFYAANQRLLKDARANLFVTAFYGVLNPDNGTLTYCNAGHNPPYLFKNSDSATVHPLERTGMALGVEADNTWTQTNVSIDPGDVVQASLGLSAHELQAAVLDSVQKFANNGPQSDDITLMILERDA